MQHPRILGRGHIGRGRTNIAPEKLLLHMVKYVRVRRNLVVILTLPDSRCRSRVRKGESKIYIMKKVFFFIFIHDFVFRGVSFATGGEGNWRTAPTLANLFRHFQILLMKHPYCIECML
jgi:hypothetical protein